MGATKTHQYSEYTIQLAKIADALGHPARITILEHLRENPELRMTDFQSILGLSETAVLSHFRKLNTANLINYKYTYHEYQLILRVMKLFELGEFLEK